MRKVDNPFNFRDFGQAVKEARKKMGLTRAQFEDKYNIDERYLLEIENNGQHCSLQIFYELATIFSISVDEYFFPTSEQMKNSRRRRIDSLLDTFNNRELAIVESTVNGVNIARDIAEG
jgi:transcriptional regulator with XRE-family HTH domain